MFARHAPPRYGHGAGFGVGRINHVKKNNPKPFPAPPLTPFDIRGVRHAQLKEKNENKAPPTVVSPRKKYRPRTKKEILLQSLKKALTPPELQVPLRHAPAPAPVGDSLTLRDPKFPGGLTFHVAVPPAPEPAPEPLPEFGAETAKHYADELRECDLDDEAMRVLRVFEALKIQGQTRERYHENEVALDLAAELQPEREKYRAMDCAHAAKREKRYLRKLAEAEERAERERKAEEARLEKERKREEERRVAEERKRQQREDENNRRIAAEHQRRQEERIWREKMREEERQRKLRAEQERARRVAEARRSEDARRAQEAEKQRKIAEEQKRLAMLAEMRRLKAEREEAMRLAKEQEERMRQAVLEERRAALEALRQATREANEMMAQMERDQAAKDAFVRAAEYRAHLMEQELRAREQHQYAQAQAFMEQLEQAYREHAMLEQAFRDAQQRGLFEQQQRAAQEAQERAEREQREAAEAAAREAEARAAQAARQAEAAANEAAIAKHICDWYDHRWTVLKTRKDIDGQVAYCEFPIPYFPFIQNVEAPIPASPHPSEITYEQVRAFVFSPYRTSMAAKNAKERIRAEMLFWHPDKFESKYLRLMQPQDKAIAMEAVNVLARILTQIKENVETEQWKAKEAAEKAGAA
ncbi:hypothetical protein C8T65DRAFT_27042 [Cerioporus squamosus]|nr:hypothetical protein C8T65DRAFT_27042 [Cerioporus squamosus]